MIVVCVKWVDLRPEIDPITGAVHEDPRRHGFSDGDRAALEVGLQLAEGRGAGVTLVSVAPPEAEGSLRELAAAGASALVRVDAPSSTDAASVGTALADAVGALEAVDTVICGDYSADRGSGSVPAFVAHHLGWAMALGLVGVADGDPMRLVRRLDGGRREHLTVAGPAVLSVEGSVARLRRASLSALLAAKSLPLTVRALGTSPVHVPVVERTEPVRPRARAFAPPHGDNALDRIVELTGALVERTPPRRVVAEPADAAAAILDQLRTWGHVQS